MSLLTLFVTFFRVGLFTIGGGLAALPLLHDEMVGGGWIVEERFVDMLAVSQSTPGPIGINMATYVGYTTAAVPGALVATLGMVTPSVIIILLIAKFMQNFAGDPRVVSVLGCLRPTAVGLIGAACCFVLVRSVFATGIPLFGGLQVDATAAILGLVLTAVRYRTKLHPILIILAGGLVGMVVF